MVDLDDEVIYAHRDTVSQVVTCMQGVCVSLSLSLSLSLPFPFPLSLSLARTHPSSLPTGLASGSNPSSACPPAAVQAAFAGLSMPHQEVLNKVLVQV